MIHTYQDFSVLPFKNELTDLGIRACTEDDFKMSKETMFKFKT